MKTIWTDSHRREIEERMSRLAPDTVPLWGRMNAPQVVAHLTQATMMASGELPVRFKRTPLRFTPLKQLALYLLPFPKGSPTAPELLARVPGGDWPKETAELRAAFDRLTVRGRSAPWPRHPLFGDLSATGWGVLVYRHTDHHLRQFGV